MTGDAEAVWDRMTALYRASRPPTRHRPATMSAPPTCSTAWMVAGHTRSKTAANPCPPPMHMVSRP